MHAFWNQFTLCTLEVMYIHICPSVTLCYYKRQKNLLFYAVLWKRQQKLHVRPGPFYYIQSHPQSPCLVRVRIYKHVVTSDAWLLGFHWANWRYLAIVLTDKIFILFWISDFQSKDHFNASTLQIGYIALKQAQARRSDNTNMDQCSLQSSITSGILVDVVIMDDPQSNVT